MIYNRYIIAKCQVCQIDTSTVLTIYFLDTDRIGFSTVCKECKSASHDPFPLIARCLNLNHLTFERFIDDNENYQDAADNFYADNKWIQKYMDALGWWWICVCGGDVIAGSANRSDFPTEEQKKSWAAQHNAIPFCYTQPFVSEQIEIGT